MAITKFIKTTYDHEFINVDFIVAIKKDYGYHVKMCDGLWYEIDDYEEGKRLYEYLRNQKLEKKGDK